MNILLLSQWYPPEPMKLLSDMAEGLQSMGHNVSVLTGFPNWPSGIVYPNYKIKAIQRETVNDVKLFRIALYPNHSKSAMKRILNLASFAMNASCMGAMVVPKPDIIHAIQPPTTMLAAWVLSKIWGVPFTYEVQDMWPETLQATNMVNNPRALDLVGKYCLWAYRKASAIRVISPGFKKNLLYKGVPEQKIHYIPNWVDYKFYAEVSGDPDNWAQKLDLKNHFNIVYAGTVGLAQDLDTLLDAAQRLRDIRELQFVICGDGVELNRLKEKAEACHLDNVRFAGRIPIEDIPLLYSLSQVLLVHLKQDPLFSITIPHKTLTYLASGKPILAAMEGDVAELISNAKAGFVCPSSNPKMMEDAVRKIYATDPSILSEMGENGKKTAEESFGMESLLSRLFHMFEIAKEEYCKSKGD
jgi:colanic acid biosynthesis glycosyl transferase WcaI